MRLSGTKTGAVNQYRGLGNQLWDLAGNRPSLDLPFSDTKSLVDTTTGKTLVDHTRASSGTYVGSDGLIKTATTNLLSWSEDFTNAAWQATSPGEVTLIPGVADPFGGTNATTFFHNSGAGDTGWLRRLNSGTIGLSYRLSFWVRRRSGSGAFIVVLGDNISQTISGITSEWQRVSVSNIPTSTILRTYFKADSAGDQFDVFGAQLEQSSTVGEYVKTTSTINSAPRFDHDPTTGESLGLLVEESRTNLLTYSEEFDNAAWTNQTSSVTPNATTAPNGTATADLLIVNNGANLGSRAQDFAKAASPVTYTLSCFVKSKEHNKIRFIIRDTLNSTNRTDVTFNADTGQILASYTGGSYSGGSYNYTDFGNGWRRFNVTATTGSETTVRGQIINDTNPGDGTSGIYIWGAQLEAGSFPTSYIPTEGSTVTRAADVASISGSNFSSWFTSPGENTFYAEYQRPPGTGQILEGYDGGNIVGMSLSLAPTAPRTTARHGPSRCDTNVSLPPYIAGTNKHVGATSASGSAAAANGTVLTTGTPGQSDWTATSSLAIGYRGAYNTERCNTTIKRITVWPQRLPNETLETITN